MSFIDNFNKNTRIRTKMTVLIIAVLLISIIPLSLIILNRSQEIVLKMTNEICTNLAQNISNVATEELLIRETYDTTKTSVSRLKSSNITGLKDTYVINIDGIYVADMKESMIDKPAPESDIKYFRNLKNLEMTEISKQGRVMLRFSYPIFIDYHKSKMPVGTAVFEFDKIEIYDSVQRIRMTILVVSVVLFIVGLAIAFYSATIFSKPILKLSESAKRIGEGDLNHRIHLSGKDEIGQLATTFNQMTGQIQDFTQNLEDKVDQRTRELNKAMKELNSTLQEVQALKVAQDGDYYLTSLLINPLQPNNNTSAIVKTEFIIQQKKKFSFRKWEAEIGGDICITDSIFLNKREYTVFINGDAMGKSIQGAGGALVLGVVFNAGLMRSKVEKYQNIYPESWLKERFLDLHNVFLSFEGSMYISICMGLVDNETGLLYYLNAEHPWTVLYRDGKASFLEEELALRKLGTPEQEEKFYVRLFQLMSGDVLITGSDGRDDLILLNSKGEEFVQEDEYEFLRRVEEGRANLSVISQRIHQTGKIMDDFSLLRLSYNENYTALESEQVPPEVAYTVKESLTLAERGKMEEAYKNVESLLKDYKNLPDLLKLLGKVYYNQADYSKTIQCFEQYVSLNPGDNEYLYALSNTYRIYGKWSIAADIGERLYLRDQKHLLNLINLSTIYLNLKVFGRSLMMLDKAIALDPTNDLILEFRDEIIRARELKDFSNANHLLGDAEQVFKEAEAKYKNKEFEEALELYERLLDSGKYNNPPRLLLKIANCYTHKNELDKAIQYYNRTLSEDDLNFHARNNLGGIYFKQGDFNKAKFEWKKTIEIKTDFKPAVMNLARLEKLITANNIANN
jgi:tetratricopeptide (TPR) repeat protein/HAMP domain-containing protein